MTNEEVKLMVETGEPLVCLLEENGSYIDPDSAVLVWTNPEDVYGEDTHMSSPKGVVSVTYLLDYYLKNNHGVVVKGSHLDSDLCHFMTGT